VFSNTLNYLEKLRNFLKKKDKLCQISLVATPGVQSLLPQNSSKAPTQNIKLKYLIHIIRFEYALFKEGHDKTRLTTYCKHHENKTRKILVFTFWHRSFTFKF
jgi:hypothetical protein